MPKPIYCIDCLISLGELASGSKILKSISYRCKDCEAAIKLFRSAEALKRLNKSNSPNIFDNITKYDKNSDVDFSKIFGDLLGGKNGKSC